MDTPKCIECGVPLPDAKGDPEPVCPRCFMEAMGSTAPPERVSLSEPSATNIRPREVMEASPDAVYGKFVCTERLGEGGMAEVWKAWDKELFRWGSTYKKQT